MAMAPVLNFKLSSGSLLFLILAPAPGYRSAALYKTVLAPATFIYRLIFMFVFFHVYVCFCCS